MENYQKSFVLNLLAYAAQKDVSPAQLCRLSGMDLPALIHASPVNLTPKQLNDLWLNACHLSGDALFGLHLGESMQLAALGVVGQLIQNSRTIGEALTHGAAFLPRITDLFTLEVIRSGATITTRLVAHEDRTRASPFVFRQMGDLFMVFIIHELDGLVLKKIKPEQVTLPYSVPDGREYERVLRCRHIEQASEDYAMVFADAYWDEPILTANYELQSRLLQQVAGTDAWQPAQPLRERIHRFLRDNAYLGLPTLEEMAANFNLSSRSLQRRLQQEGVTYQQLADTVRKSLALHYLESNRYPVKEISYILGYNELSAFARAFKRWTGTTPVNYQKR